MPFLNHMPALGFALMFGPFAAIILWVLLRDYVRRGH